MKTSVIVPGVLLFVSAAGGPLQDVQFSDWMETANQNVGRLALSLQGKDTPEATAAAKKLQEVFREVETFFKQSNSSRAVEYASDAQAGFRKVEELIAAAQLEEAYKTMQVTRSVCDNCHKEHRERAPDGSYRIRY